MKSKFLISSIVFLFLFLRKKVERFCRPPMTTAGSSIKGEKTPLTDDEWRGYLYERNAGWDIAAVHVNRTRLLRYRRHTVQTLHVRWREFENFHNSSSRYLSVSLERERHVRAFYMIRINLWIESKSDVGERERLICFFFCFIYLIFFFSFLLRLSPHWKNLEDIDGGSMGKKKGGVVHSTVVSFCWKSLGGEANRIW